MSHRIEALGAHRDLIAPALAVALGGAVAAVLVSGVHNDHSRVVMILAAVVSLTGGLYSVYSAVKLMGPPAAATMARAQSAQRRYAELKREVWRHAAAAFTEHPDTSPMELRMTDSLKSIRDQAEQGLVAADAEKAAHLAAIWSMAACDLYDDLDQVAH